MKALSMDLRERVVAFVKEGGSKMEAARCFQMARRSVYRYLEAEQKGSLEPKKIWGTWRKLDPEKLAEYVRGNPDAKLKEMGKAFKVSHQAVWVRLRQLGITLKKAIRYPCNARLYNRARKRLVKSARQHGLKIKQSYQRLNGEFGNAINAILSAASMSFQKLLGVVFGFHVPRKPSGHTPRCLLIA